MITYRANTANRGKIMPTPEQPQQSTSYISSFFTKLKDNAAPLAQRLTAQVKPKMAALANKAFSSYPALQNNAKIFKYSILGTVGATAAYSLFSMHRHQANHSATVAKLIAEKEAYQAQAIYFKEKTDQLRETRGRR
jgi:hypothetical protein